MALPYTFSNGTLANADEVNSNFNACYPKIIGNVKGAMGVEQQFKTDITYTANPVITSFFIINGTCHKNAGNAAVSVTLHISGPGMNFDFSSLSASASTDTKQPYFNHVITSGTFTASGGNLGSNYVFSIAGSADPGTAWQRGDFLVWGV